jgi:hypothetical protein
MALTLGTYAWKVHGTLWCGKCARRHQLTCQTVEA